MKWLLTRLFGADDGRAALSELQELYELRRARDGEGPARRWRRRQLIQYPFRWLAAREPASVDVDVPSPESTWRRLLRDLRYAGRSLRRSPMTAITIVLTVGVALGVTVTIAGMTEAVLIRPLPYPEPSRLVRVFTDSAPNVFPFSVADYRALDREQTVFEDLTGYQPLTFTFTGRTSGERVRGKAVTASYLPLFGLRPIHGRLFNHTDAGGAPVAVVSRAFWARALEGDPAVVGRSITLDGVGYLVAGVIDPGTGPLERGIDVFTLERWPTPTRKGPFFMIVVGRLKPGIDVAAANAELRSINRRMFPIWKSSYQDERATWTADDLKTAVIGKVTRPLVLVTGAALLLFAIATVNAANLIVVRAVRRRREAAVRVALGASRGRLVSLLFSENLLLAAGAGALGAGLAIAGLRLAASVGAAYVPRTSEFGLSGAVLALLAALVTTSVVVFTLVPLVTLIGVRADAALRAGRSGSEGVRTRRLRRVLVAAEFAAATPLLIAAGLLGGSLWRLQQVDAGFTSSRVITLSLSLPRGSYPEQTDVRAGYERLLSRVAAVPGVTMAAFADSRPPVEASNINNFDLEDRPTPPGQDQPVSPWISVSPEYFETMGIAVDRGRRLDSRDFIGDAPPVVVVDRAWAQKYFPREEVLGRRFKEGGCTTCPWTTVVGVASTVNYSGLDVPAAGAIYSPLPDAFRSRFLIARTDGSPGALAPALTRAVREVDATLPVTRVATGDELLSASLEMPRYLSRIVIVFSVVALAVAALGIFGVMSQMVEQQSRDIGIRLALGGAPSTVWRMIAGSGLRTALAGTLVGIALAFGLTRFLRTLLFGVDPADVLTFGVVSLGVIAVAAIAGWLPARRAARIDPATILRDS